MKTYVVAPTRSERLGDKTEWIFEVNESSLEAKEFMNKIYDLLEICECDMALLKRGEICGQEFLSRVGPVLDIRPGKFSKDLVGFLLNAAEEDGLACISTIVPFHGNMVNSNKG